MLKIHKQLTSDPLQKRSNISIYPSGYGMASPKMQSEQKRFEQLSKQFDNIKTSSPGASQGGNNASAPG